MNKQKYYLSEELKEKLVLIIDKMIKNDFFQKNVIPLMLQNKDKRIQKLCNRAFADSLAIELAKEHLKISDDDWVIYYIPSAFVNFNEIAEKHRRSD